MDFEWDEFKNKINIAKHGIDFIDTRNDYDEFRHICIGCHKNGILIFVVYTYRDDAIRIISARKATPRERRLYYGNR